ncbi:MAG: hypothetical protein ABIF19_18640 [Planctomycetota bacterium]
MKRISISAAAMLIIVSSVAQGHSYYGYDSVRHRVRWSIYAHSLIPGELHYSPYANKYGSTGLVPYWVRYSPYAYSHKHPSGLVDDHASSMSTIYYSPDNYTYSDFSGPGNVSVRCSSNVDSDVSLSGRQRDSYETKLQALKLRARTLEELRQQRSKITATGGKDIIAQYLAGQDIDFRTTRILQVEGKTVSVDFLLADGNVLIKYWNPLEILALEHKAEYKKKAYEEYLESWKGFCSEFQRAGGKVYQIISADTGEISTELAKLIISPKDSPDPDEGKRAYALDRVTPQP